MEGNIIRISNLYLRAIMSPAKHQTNHSPGPGEIYSSRSDGLTYASQRNEPHEQIKE